MKIITVIGARPQFIKSGVVSKALKKHSPNLTAQEMVEESLHIAADICIYTNHNLVIETLD